MLGRTCWKNITTSYILQVEGSTVKFANCLCAKNGPPLCRTPPVPTHYHSRGARNCIQHIYIVRQPVCCLLSTYIAEWCVATSPKLPIIELVCVCRSYLRTTLRSVVDMLCQLHALHARRLAVSSTSPSRFPPHHACNIFCQFDTPNGFFQFRAATTTTSAHPLLQNCVRQFVCGVGFSEFMAQHITHTHVEERYRCENAQTPFFTTWHGMNICDASCIANNMCVVWRKRVPICY